MSTANEVQNLLGLFGITAEGAIVKLETTVANTEHQLEEIEGKRAPLVALLAASRRHLAFLRGEKPAAAGAKPPKAAKAKATSSGQDGAVLEKWSAQSIEPGVQTGKPPGDPVKVTEFASEKLARLRLAELERIGYHYSTVRPLRPGQVAFTHNRNGYYLLVNPLNGAER